ncbi:BQ5605_C005g03191 [Microbotryum silenes-dioicae]|uniref:M-phase inducer phosphatase n=1 Tax=Microbotryum silenes-dioicae TaxID=796604 RepID=A0A2X0MDA6_9BASI|nr:BQ5605_C005g03191 [Microbotryum silenes-dioicae]
MAMALLSSSPAAHDFASRRKPPRIHSSLLAIPSSPTAAYHNGELSPTLDSSFASSMSLSSDAPLPAGASFCSATTEPATATTTTTAPPPAVERFSADGSPDALRVRAPSSSGSGRAASNLSGRHIAFAPPITSKPSHVLAPTATSSLELAPFAQKPIPANNADDVDRRAFAALAPSLGQSTCPVTSSTLDRIGRENSGATTTTSTTKGLTGNSSPSPAAALSSPSLGNVSAMDVSPAGAAIHSRLRSSVASTFGGRAGLALNRTESGCSTASSVSFASSSSSSSTSSSSTTTKTSEGAFGSSVAAHSEFPFLKNLLFRQPRPSISTASSVSSTASCADDSNASYAAEMIPSNKPRSREQALEASPALTSTAPLSIRPRMTSGQSPPRPLIKHYATVPPSNADRLLPPFQQFHINESSAPDGQTYGGSTDTDEDETEEQGPMAPPPMLTGNRRRHGLPSEWSSGSLRRASTDGSLKPPPHPSPVKRASHPNLGSRRIYDVNSSPSHMDVDGSSPATSPVAMLRHRNHPRSVSDSASRRPSLPECDGQSPLRPDIEVISSDSGASSRLGDIFADDLSPIPPSRKRFLSDERDFLGDPASPSPALCAPTSLFGLAPARRPIFEKAVSTSTLPANIVRRQRSSATLGLRKRPSLSSFATMGPSVPAGPASASLEALSPFATAAAGFKRHAVTSITGKPKPMRRAFSVADAAVQLVKREHNALDTSNRASIATETRAFADIGRHADPTGADLCSAIASSTKPLKTLQDTGSPVTGFRSQEAKGKVLPCFGVKQDGLMRITASTLNDLQSGLFASRIKRYHIIDCRFDYEFDGGHIRDAVNIPELAEVEESLLHNSPPKPSTSEQAPGDGKTVLIFHCEFSAKRAPTTAQHLRKQDRLKNHHDYPNIHYPEVYVLQGGYAEFYRSFPERCIGGYLAMDDPEHMAKRSTQLNNFRQRKRQFQRANTFTFGQGQQASMMMQTATMATRPPLHPSQSHNIRGSLDETFSFPAKASTNKPMSMSMAMAMDQSPSASAGTENKNKSKAKPGMLACHEDENEGADSSFGTNGSSPSGAGDSPCPGGKLSRHSVPFGRKTVPNFAPAFRPPSAKQPFAIGGGGTARRTFERAHTSAALMFKQ